MSRTIRFLIIAILICCLIGARFFFQEYLYDPFYSYYKHGYLVSSFPEVEMGSYFLNLFLRYSINSALSLGIIYFVFMKNETLIFSMKFYVAGFVGFGLFLYVLLFFEYTESQLLVFYVRRFLIQPVFLLILLPAFYLQKWRKIN